MPTVPKRRAANKPAAAPTREVGKRLESLDKRRKGEKPPAPSPVREPVPDFEAFVRNRVAAWHNQVQDWTLEAQGAFENNASPLAEHLDPEARRSVVSALDQLWHALERARPLIPVVALPHPDPLHRGEEGGAK